MNPYGYNPSDYTFNNPTVKALPNMTPSTQPKTKPSELAMKAAAEIIQMFPGGDKWQTPASISETIDRETNLPTLLKQRDALKEALKEVISGLPSKDECPTNAPWQYHFVGYLGDERLKKIQSALALCDKE